MPGMRGRGRGPIKKEKFDVKSFGRILAYCKPYLPAIIISLVFAVLGSIATIIGPDKIQDLTNIVLDGMLTGINMSAFVRIAVFLIVLYSS